MAPHLPVKHIRDPSRPSTALAPQPIAQADLARPSRPRPWIAGPVGSGHIWTTTIGYIDDQPSLSRRRRFALLAGLGAADDLTGRRDENWLTGMGAAITGSASDRR